MNINVRQLAELGPADLQQLFDRRPHAAEDVVRTCQAIIEAVAARGDSAVLEFTRAYDQVELSADQLRVTDREIDAACDSVAPQVTAAIDQAIANIQRYHTVQETAADRWLEVEPGVWCGERSSPIEAVCLYVPRGRGAFPSVACMLGVPAGLAGVPRVVVCTPPGPQGAIDAATLYACKRIGITEIYRIGGAQAVAATALGTQSMARCDKFIGPGNVYVSAARQLLAGFIDPGSPAGPSEALILCDGTSDPRNAAWNLLIEAEHGENSAALLVTHDRRLAAAVVDALDGCLEQLSAQRRTYAETVLQERGGILLTASLEDSIAFANRFAPEHLALMVADPWSVHPRLTNAGEIVFGDYPIISLANYAMGMNAILPTGSSARYASPVSVRDFTKVTSLGFCTKQGRGSLAPVVSALSRDEGFSAHHLAVEQWRDPIIQEVRS